LERRYIVALQVSWHKLYVTLQRTWRDGWRTRSLEHRTILSESRSI